MVGVRAGKGPVDLGQPWGRQVVRRLVRVELGPGPLTFATGLLDPRAEAQVTPLMEI
ncbi:hypothetical protein NQZ68_031695 [Dissostichus eleginoides]|nr:hypothetical protein NQZ68_038213 [Dissostichus eleginoides]KAI9536621.1 hypothetical protein NQZ68_031695 [Dissostichus eleginoides]